jgi:hypothetical protein
VDLITRWALTRPRVLLVDAPGPPALRWSAETELDRRGWLLATSPADADLLVVLGDPGRKLTAATDLLWAQVPAPRARAAIPTQEQLTDRLDDAADRLRDRNPAPADPWTTAEPRSDDMGGLEMAGSAPDRDGLELDALDVTLGPWLPGWPTGLVLQGRLQGDVLTDVDARWLDGEGPAGPSEPVPPGVVALDALARLLLVAGWPRQATAARRARTALLDGSPDGRRRAGRVAEVVARSRTLAWSLRDLPAVAGQDPLTRLRSWCASATDPVAAPPPSPALRELAQAADGAELAAVRLLVATCAPGPRPEVLDAPLQKGVRRG